MAYASNLNYQDTAEENISQATHTIPQLETKDKGTKLATIRTQFGDKISRVIKASTLFYKDRVLKNEKVQEKFPVWWPYQYKTDDNKVLSVDILYYKWKYAILSNGKQWLRVKISNLNKKLSLPPQKNNVVSPDFQKQAQETRNTAKHKVDNVVFPDFGENNQEEKQHASINATKNKPLFPQFAQQNISSITNKNTPDISSGIVFVSKIAQSFASYKTVDKREWLYLLKNKPAKLLEINQHLSFVTQQKAAHTISLKNIVPIPRIEKIFWEISNITDAVSREKSMKTFIAYYIRFLAIRRDFLMNNDALPSQIPSTNVIPFWQIETTDIAIDWEYIANGEFKEKDHHLKQVA